jgi:hypothetical protein
MVKMKNGDGVQIMKTKKQIKIYNSTYCVGISMALGPIFAGPARNNYFIKAF